jgi:mevalonate kinase
MGLTIPYKRFSGQLQYAKKLNDNVRDSSAKLRGFYEYLKKLSDQKELMAKLDLTEFKDDLDQNLYFNSNIPQSYGVGSSGAICAAVYNAYYINKKSDPDCNRLPELKQKFAQMESYFHGVSSGLDPLNAYLKKTLLIHNKEDLEVVEYADGFKKGELTTFLIDTKMSGETEQLVHIFFDKCRQYKFYKQIKNSLIPLNNTCIELYVNGELNKFLTAIEKLSLFFIENFKPMIPFNLLEQWEKGINSKLYTLKLCGSGGGGFLLGFTTDYEATKKEFPEFSLQKLEV